MLNTKYAEAWDLDVIFPGGSTSQVLRTYIEETKKNLDDLMGLVECFNPIEVIGNEESMISLLASLEAVMKQVKEIGAYVSCLSAQDTADQAARLLVSERSELGARVSTVATNFDQKLIMIADDDWKTLLAHPEINDLAFILNEFRTKAKDKLPLEEEILLNDLAVDGYHGWGQMYDTIVGKMTVDIEENGKTETYSVGQAASKLSSPDRAVRKQTFDKLEAAWGEKSDLFAQTLNHLAGFRLQTYKHRGWDEILQEPLELNRMKKETLDVMWDSIVKYKAPFVKYLEKKAELLGLNKLSVYDVEAPLTAQVSTVDYSVAADFIVEHFRTFSPKMADFAQMTFDKGWIEAEDRSGKMPGGFCTSFPDSEQTRIFMTYAGTPSSIATLAHELGHAYHQHVMNDVNGLNQRYAMNVAETASTFAEMIVADAAVANAKNLEEKAALLEDKIQRSVAFFMNIHARFIFEQNFYEARKKGMVSVEQLNKLMAAAQEEAYCGALDNSDPTFWASKLHFHITGVPFYNFPYTFGYLFSLGIYAHAKQQMMSFEDDYIALLRDTGKMTVEQLAMKHLGVDITKPAFWEAAIEICIADVEAFLTL